MLCMYLLSIFKSLWQSVPNANTQFEKFKLQMLWFSVGEKSIKWPCWYWSLLFHLFILNSIQFWTINNNEKFKKSDITIFKQLHMCIYAYISYQHCTVTKVDHFFGVTGQVWVLRCCTIPTWYVFWDSKSKDTLDELRQCTKVSTFCSSFHFFGMCFFRCLVLIVEWHMIIILKVTDATIQLVRVRETSKWMIIASGWSSIELECLAYIAEWLWLLIHYFFKIMNWYLYTYALIVTLFKITISILFQVFAVLHTNSKSNEPSKLKGSQAHKTPTRFLSIM